VLRRIHFKNIAEVDPGRVYHTHPTRKASVCVSSDHVDPCLRGGCCGVRLDDGVIGFVWFSLGKLHIGLDVYKVFL
jgi:hypothetical protein